MRYRCATVGGQLSWDSNPDRVGHNPTDNPILTVVKGLGFEPRLGGTQPPGLPLPYRLVKYSAAATSREGSSSKNPNPLLHPLQRNPRGLFVV